MDYDTPHSSPRPHVVDDSMRADSPYGGPMNYGQTPHLTVDTNHMDTQTTGRSRGVITSELRMKKDLAELAQAKMTSPHVQTTIDFPDGDVLHLRVTLRVAAGFYAGGTFVVSLKVPSNYPFRAPTATALTRVWHPNIDVENGRIRHPLLERDWKPVLSINTVVFGLQLLFLEPNVQSAEVIANAAAAQTLLHGRDAFADDVRRTLRGGTFGGHPFPSHTHTSPRAAPSRKRQCDEDDLRADVKRLSVRDGRGSPRTVLDPTSSPRSFVPVQHPPAQYYRTADGYPISVPARHAS